MVPEVAEMLARLSHRVEFVGDDDLVFPGEIGGYLDGSALRRRFLAACGRAGLRPIRFHDLRHTFGTLAVRGAESIVELQNWLGHVEVRTTLPVDAARPLYLDRVSKRPETSQDVPRRPAPSTDVHERPVSGRPPARG